MSDEELNASFVAVFRKIADNLNDWDGRALQKDLECEFALRNKEPPYEQLGEELERFFAAHSEYLKALETENPERWIEMNAEINRDFQQFVAERKNAN